MKRYLLLLAFGLAMLPVAAQTFKGSIHDEKGNVVPYASVYLKELKSGLTTDDNGCFELTVAVGKYTCEVSSLGYVAQTFQLDVPKGGVAKTFVLSERVYELQEVSVVEGAENPAYAIMRKVIAHAPYYRMQVKGYTAGTYLKGTGKAKEIPAILKISKSVRKEAKEVMNKLYVLEEQRLVTFRAPDHWENQVKAYTNSFPDNMSVEIELTGVKLYESTLFSKVSPLSVGAFSYYDFKLEGCYAEGDRLVNKIRVLPKQDNPRLLSGYLYVVEDLWCVSAVDFSMKMTGARIAVKVTCKEVKPDVFMPASMSVGSTFDVMGFKAEATYLAAIHYTQVEVADCLTPASRQEFTRKESYRFSKKMEKQMVRNDQAHTKHKYERTSQSANVKVNTDSLAGKRDAVYWAAVRSVPLRQEELDSYLGKRQIDFRKDSIRRLDSTQLGKKQSKVPGQIMQTFLLGNTFKSKDKKSWLRFYNLASYVPEYNLVDGFWLGGKWTAGTHLGETTLLSLTPEVYYTTARRSVVGTGLLTLQYAPRRMGRLELSGGVLSADYNNETGESRLINSLAVALFGRNDVKFYDKRYLKIGNEIELANSLLFSTSLSWEQRKMLDNRISKSWFGRMTESNIPNTPAFHPMPENRVLKASFALEYTPAHYYHMRKGWKVYDKPRFPTFTFRYDRAFPLGGSMVSPSYHLTEFTVEQEVEFGMFNRLYWSANAGGFWGARNMQFPDFKHFATTRFPLTAHSFDTGFALLDNYAYSTDRRWAQAHLTWNTPYLALKQLPFLKRANFDEALHLRTLVIYGRRPYTEIGYSVGLPNNLLRVGVFAGFEGVKYHSVGISVTLNLSKITGY